MCGEQVTSDKVRSVTKGRHDKGECQGCDMKKVTCDKGRREMKG